MMGYYGNNWGWDGAYPMMGWSNPGWIMMILFWVLIIVAFFVFVKWMKDQSIGDNNNKRRISKTASDILEERYVKGEIDREEFLKKKKDIEE